MQGTNKNSEYKSSKSDLQSSIKGKGKYVTQIIHFVGGIKRIGIVASKLVPLMVIIYLLCGFYIIISNLCYVFLTIFSPVFVDVTL